VPPHPTEYTEQDATGDHVRGKPMTSPDLPPISPELRRAHRHSFWVGKRDQPDARSVTLRWLPPIPVNVQGVEDLTTTVSDVVNAE
jgi:hypothetical protein